MKQKKVVKYHLKVDVLQDLIVLNNRIRFLLDGDLVGFDKCPKYSNLLPALFKVFSHLVWCRSLESWFKKVYYNE